MIDIYFIEFYINRLHNQKLEEYFGVVSSVTSGWRHGKFPEKRLHEFCFKENSNNKNWDGYDFYDKKYIRENYKEFHYLHGNYPTIDHKISVYEGFKNSILAEEIGSINNLCITKRFINSKKYNKSNFTL